MQMQLQCSTEQRCKKVPGSLFSFTCSDNGVLSSAAKKVPKPTSGFSRVLFYSEQEAHNFGRAKVSGVDVLAAMFNEYDCHCIHLLVQSGLNRFDAVSLIAKDEHYCDEHAA